MFDGARINKQPTWCQTWDSNLRLHSDIADRSLLPSMTLVPPSVSRTLTGCSLCNSGRWFRMPFGISSAPEEFQRRQHEILEGLAGIEVIADDILVYGYDETEEEALLNHDKT